MSARLLADENIYRELVDAIRDAGWDIETVQERGLSGAPDRQILQRARDENRTLLTFDRDFGDIRYLPRDVPGIFLLRFRDAPIEDLVDRVLEVLHAISEEEIRRHLVVITPSTVRRRSLGLSPTIDDPSAA